MLTTRATTHVAKRETMKDLTLPVSRPARWMNSSRSLRPTPSRKSSLRRKAPPTRNFSHPLGFLLVFPFPLKLQQRGSCRVVQPLSFSRCSARLKSGTPASNETPRGYPKDAIQLGKTRPCKQGMVTCIDRWRSPLHMSNSIPAYAPISRWQQAMRQSNVPRHLLI